MHSRISQARLGAGFLETVYQTRPDLRELSLGGIARLSQKLLFP